MRLLDLYCSAGGASMGYYQAGFTDITGIDTNPQPRYPFRFIQADALEYIKEHGCEYDVIVASPPCQYYNSLSKLNGKLYGKIYPDLIAATRQALQVTGKPYVIENVMDARKHLINPVMLCGMFFGLKVYRHRLFECSPSLSHLQPEHKPHNDFSPGCRGDRTSPNGFITVCGGKGGGFRLEPASKAMGIDWMTRKELALAIPPAYTRWIGKHLLELLTSCLQPTNADIGKPVYCDALERRGVILDVCVERQTPSHPARRVAVVDFSGAVQSVELEELELIKYRWGADGVGRGNCAGLNIWAVVGVPEGLTLAGVRDSKNTKAHQREKLVDAIRTNCVVGLGAATPNEIDELGIDQAEELALSRAIASVQHQGYEPSDVMGDLKMPKTRVSFKREKSADAIYLETSAASIVAKHALDLYWARVNEHYPGYGLVTSSGYVTKAHISAMNQRGLIADIHRLSYEPCKQINQQTTGENIMLAQDLDAFVTLDLSAEIAKHEEQLKQIHSRYDANVAEFKKRKINKSAREYKSVDKKYTYDTRAITSQIAALKSCQSLPIGSSVTHQEKGDGVLKGFVIDVRKVVMAVVVFELGEAEVAPHSLKAIKGNALSVKPVVTPQVESEITEASPEQETIQQSEPTLAAETELTEISTSLESYLEKPAAVPDDADAIATAVEIAGSSDQDECERIITEINELDAKFEFEVGRRLLRLQQIWKPSHEFRLFGDYCEAKLGRKFSKTRRNELINAAKVQGALPNSPAFTSTNATKPVWRMLAAGVAPEEVQELVKEVAASGNLTKEAIENKAQDKGLLPKKSAPKPATTAEQETKAIGQQLGLPGIGERQLPDVAPNVDIEPAAIKPLKDCVTMNEVIDAILASPASAFEEFRLVDWQERNRLRELCSDISTRFRALESEEFHVGAMLTFLELADKDSKIEWLETQLAGARVPLVTDASVEEYIESLSVEQLQDAQIKIAARLMELGLEEVKPASTRTDEWYTPPEYIEMAREVMGSIDLDPASNDLAQSWIQAAQYYTKNDDGLSKAWLGNVWCNPPYGRDVENWLVDALCRYECGEIKSAILLLNRTGAAWYRARIKEVTAICEVYKRIAFIDGNGERQASPRHYNDFLYLGTDIEKFREVFSAVGDVRVTQHLEQAAA